MSSFIGRKYELDRLSDLQSDSRAKLVVIKGRRRIGKSRLAEEFGRHLKGYRTLYFEAAPPEKHETQADERKDFARQLGRMFNVPPPPTTDWDELFWQLAARINDSKQKTLVIFDEINWMGRKDRRFPGKLKTAWDSHFSKVPDLILILTGSLAGWIKRNLLNSVGYVGRVDQDFTLQELSLPEAVQFWGSRGTRVTAHEKFRYLAVSGGVPRYLEAMNPAKSVDTNILRLCFEPQGLLFREYDTLFSDLFDKRNTSYRDILEHLAEAPLDLEGLFQALKAQRSGWISKRVTELIDAGFVTRDYTWNIVEGKESRFSRLRISDNYIRFYLKAIRPHRNAIMRRQVRSLPPIDGILGLQFENIVLNNREFIWKSIGLDESRIKYHNPFFQRSTKERPGCQIDYLIQMDRGTIYVCEIKFSTNKIDGSIIEEVKQKISRITMPDAFSYHPVLIHVNGVSDAVTNAGYFDEIIDFSTAFEV